MPRSLSSSTTWLRAKAIRCHAVPAAGKVGSASSTRLCIINALLGITATMLATIALGSITTAALPALLVSGAAQSATAAAAVAANRPGLHQHHHSPGNYQGVDAVSALTGLSNGYMPSYYHQLRHAGEHQQQHPQSSPSIGPPNNPTVVDKEPTGRGLQLHASHYGNGVGGGGSGGGSAPTSPEALEIFNVPDSGFIPTTLSAAGQHYASSFLGMQSVVDKTNGHVPAALQSPSNAADKLDLQQSATTTAYASMAAAAAFNNGPPSLYGRLSNYDEESAGVGVAGSVGRSLSGMVMSSGVGDGHSFEPVYDNYAANLYNDPSTNEGEQLQNFANYFTPTTSAMGTAVGVGAGMTTSSSSSSSATAYGGGPQSPHKYLPLNNYHNAEQQHVPNQQHYQQMDKQNIYSRAISSATPTPPPLPSTTALEFYANYNYPNNNEDNKHLSSYQTWNWDMEKQLADNYYNSQEQQPQAPTPAHQHQLQLRQFQQDESEDYKEPETAESSFVLRTREKRGKNKSKRSDPLQDSYSDSYSLEGQHLQEHSTTGDGDDAETINVQQQQLEELHQQLHQQQQQFITLQHQLIDHDQQLQIAKVQYKLQPAAPGHSLPPVSQTIHHNSHSLHALSGTPLSKHTHIVRSIPVPQRQQVYVPTKQNVNIDVPDPIITTVSKPVPIEVPVSKTIAVPQIKEVKIPIERVKPFPVERPIPYLVEKRVPYTVEKQVAQPVYYHVPIKVPIVHTVIHKLHSPHAYSYQKQQHYQTHPIRYTGHIRHPSHHHHHGGYGGHGHSHYSGGGHYRK